MGELKFRINKANHLAGWAAWAFFYWLYCYFVALREPFHWGDYFGFLTIHIVSFYLSVLILFPFANPQWNRFNLRTALRMGGVVLAEVIAIPVLLSAVSAVMGTADVGLDTDADEVTVNIVNFLDQVVFLYAGVIFALFYLKFAKVEQRRDELEAEVEVLMIRLNDLQQANLQQSLIPHLYANLLRTVNELVRANPTKAAYYMHLFNQIVQFYAGLKPGDLVWMGDEEAIARAFLKLIQAKHGVTDNLVFEVEEAALGLTVIPMQVTLIMENFDKYAVWDDPEHPVRFFVGYHMAHLVLIATNKTLHGSGGMPLGTKKGIKGMTEALDFLGRPYTLQTNEQDRVFRLYLLMDIG